MRNIVLSLVNESPNTTDLVGVESKRNTTSVFMQFPHVAELIGRLSEVINNISDQLECTEKDIKINKKDSKNEIFTQASKYEKLQPHFMKLQKILNGSIILPENVQLPEIPLASDTEDVDMFFTTLFENTVDVVSYKEFMREKVIDSVDLVAHSLNTDDLLESAYKLYDDVRENLKNTNDPLKQMPDLHKSIIAFDEKNSNEKELTELKKEFDILKNMFLDGNNLLHLKQGNNDERIVFWNMINKISTEVEYQDLVVEYGEKVFNNELDEHEQDFTFMALSDSQGDNKYDYKNAFQKRIDEKNLPENKKSHLAERKPLLASYKKYCTELNSLNSSDDEVRTYALINDMEPEDYVAKNTITLGAVDVLDQFDKNLDESNSHNFNLFKSDFDILMKLVFPISKNIHELTEQDIENLSSLMYRLSVLDGNYVDNKLLTQSAVNKFSKSIHALYASLKKYQNECDGDRLENIEKSLEILESVCEYGDFYVVDKHNQNQYKSVLHKANKIKITLPRKKLKMKKFLPMFLNDEHSLETNFDMQKY